MRYMLLVTDATGAGDDRALDRAALRDELTASGELIDDGALTGPAEARVIQAAGGTPRVTGLPAGRAAVTGYWVIDCDGEARAIEIAARIAAARGLPVELRPVMTAPGLEM